MCFRSAYSLMSQLSLSLFSFWFSLWGFRTSTWADETNISCEPLENHGSQGCMLRIREDLEKVPPPAFWKSVRVCTMYVQCVCVQGVCGHVCTVCICVQRVCSVCMCDSSACMCAVCTHAVCMYINVHTCKHASDSGTRGQRLLVLLYLALRLINMSRDLSLN